jgi:hypothetical protein
MMSLGDSHGAEHARDDQRRQAAAHQGVENQRDREGGAPALMRYRQNRPQGTELDVTNAFITDMLFRVPMIGVAAAALKHNPNVCMYRDPRCVASADSEVSSRRGLGNLPATRRPREALNRDGLSENHAG